MSVLKDRICLVTGSSRGLGKAIAIALANNGATVILHGSSEKTRSVIAELPTPEKQKHHCVVADFNRREGVDDFCNSVKKITDKLHVIIHNAAILGKRATIEKYPVQDFENVMRVNLKAPFSISQQLTPLLRNGKDGSIIFVTSGVAEKVIRSQTWGAYSISKSGLEALAWILAAELQPDKIRVNLVNPGELRTDMHAEAFPDLNPMDFAPVEKATPIFVYLSRSDTKEAIPLNKSFEAQGWKEPLK
eukprot:TRINITY_DN3644_c0_g1_i4.p1 TRINITY_DN3644_c0_g1~~TRINITY_DN3644_c0_g1_i4.p1  ORF type:complete len:247 (-),score=44.27 TRINITY_DN3644_c0_g1_i4:36-776(-)